MALDTRGLMQGAAEGFQMMDQYYNRQEQSDRADRRLEMQEESFEMEKDQSQREQEMQQAQFTLGKIAQGVEPSQEEMDFLRDNPKYLPALDPRTDQDIETAQRVIDPQDPMDANDPEALDSMNHLFGHRVNRGNGGNKRIAGIFPGSREGNIAIDLEVEGEDGQSYRAPMTRNRGTESDGDEEVLETPVEDLVNQTQGYRMLRNAFNTPEAQENASKVLSALTGETPQGVNINDRLVDPTTGDVIADFSDRNEDGTWSEPVEMNGGMYQRNTESGELREVQAPGAREMEPETEYQLDRLSGELDHLHEMERRIRTGATGDFGELGVVTNGNSDKVLEDVRRRIDRNEQEMNRLLGNTGGSRGSRRGGGGSGSAAGSGGAAGTPNPEERLVEQAQQIPEEDRDEFLTDLRNHPNASDSLIQRIQQQWGGQPGQGEQTQRQSGQQGRRQGGQQGSRQPGSQRQPERPQSQPANGEARQQTMGLLSQILQSDNPEPEQGQQAGIQIPMRPGEQRQSQGQGNQSSQEQSEQRTPISGQPTSEGDNRLGPALERGLNTMRQWPEQLQNREQQQQLENMKEIARKGGATETERNQFLNFGIRNFEQAPEDVRQKLMEIFGEDTIQSRLNQ